MSVRNVVAEAALEVLLAGPDDSPTGERSRLAYFYTHIAILHLAFEPEPLLKPEGLRLGA